MNSLFIQQPRLFNVLPLSILLLNKKHRTFSATNGVEKRFPASYFFNIFREHFIVLDRSQIGRAALKSGLNTLKAGNWLFVFLEGGVSSESIDVASSRAINSDDELPIARDPAVLLKPRAGSSLLALESGVKILPIGMWGSENLARNMQRWRRTKTTIRIGEPLEPVSMPDGLRGRERRAFMDAVSDKMMYAIAELLPAKYRGPYHLGND